MGKGLVDFEAYDRMVAFEQQLAIVAPNGMTCVIDLLKDYSQDPDMNGVNAMRELGRKMAEERNRRVMEVPERE